MLPGSAWLNLNDELSPCSEKVSQESLAARECLMLSVSTLQWDVLMPLCLKGLLCFFHQYPCYTE